MLSIVDRYRPAEDGPELAPEGQPEHWGSAPGFDLGDLIDAPVRAVGTGLSALDAPGRFVRTAIGTGGDFGRAWDATFDEDQAISSTDLRRQYVDDFGTEGDGFFRGSANPLDWDYGDVLDFAMDTAVDGATNPLSYTSGGLSTAGQRARSAGQKLWGGLRGAERAGIDAGTLARSAALSEGLAAREAADAAADATRRATAEARHAAIAGYNTETIMGGKRVARELSPDAPIDPNFEGLENSFSGRARYGQNALRVGLPFTEGVEIPLPAAVANVAAVAVDPLASVLGPVWDVAKQTAIGQKVGKWLGGMRDAVLNPAVRGLAGMSERESDTLARRESMRLWREHFEPAQKELLAAGVPQEQWGLASQLAENMGKTGQTRTAEYNAVLKDLQALPETQRVALMAAGAKLKTGYEDSLRVVQKYDPEFKSLNSDLQAKLAENQADIEKTLTRLVKVRSREAGEYEKLKAKLAELKSQPSTADRVRDLQQQLRENADAIEKQIRTRTFPFDEADDAQLTADLAELGYSESEIFETLKARNAPAGSAPAIDAQIAEKESFIRDEEAGRRAAEEQVRKAEEAQAKAAAGETRGRPQGQADELTSYDQGVIAGAKALESGDEKAAAEAYSAAARRAAGAIEKLNKSGADVSEFLSPKDIKKVRMARKAAESGDAAKAQELLFDVEGDIAGVVMKANELDRVGAKTVSLDADRVGNDRTEQSLKDTLAAPGEGPGVNTLVDRVPEEMDGEELLEELRSLNDAKEKALAQARADVEELKALKAQIESAKAKADGEDLDVSIRRATGQAGGMAHMEALQQKYIRLAAKARKQFDAEIPKLTAREAKIVNEMSRIERAAQARDKLNGLLRNADGSIKSEVNVPRDEKGVRPALAASFSTKASDAVKAAVDAYEKGLYGSLSPEERVLLNRIYRKQERGLELFNTIQDIPNYVATQVNVEFAEDALARKAADVLGTPSGEGGIQKQRWRDHRGVALTARERAAQLQRGGGVEFAPGLSIPEAVQGFFKPDAVKALRAGKVLTEDPFENASAYLFGPLQKTIANAKARQEFSSVFNAVDESAWNAALADAAAVAEDGTPATWAAVAKRFQARTGVALDMLVDPRVAEQVESGAMSVADALKPSQIPHGWTKLQDFGGKSVYLPAQAAQRYAKYVTAGTERLPEFLQTVLAPLAGFTKMWKKWQLRAWPNYHIRNFVGDLFRMFQEDALDAQTPMELGTLLTGLARSARDVGEKGFDGRYQAWAGALVDVGAAAELFDGARQVDLALVLQRMEQSGVINQGYQRDIVDYARENTKRGWFKKTWEKYAPKELSVASDSARWAAGFASGREDMQRAAAMLARLRAGDSWDEAVIRTEEALFNFGRISPAAKLLSQTGVAPFAAWTAKNLPAQVKWTIENPGAAAAVAATLQRFDAGQIPEYMLKEYMQDKYNVVVERGKDEQGKEQWHVTTPDGLIPLTDLHHMAQSPKENLMGLLGPFAQLGVRLDNREEIKNPVERVIGKPAAILRKTGEGYAADGAWGAVGAAFHGAVVPLSFRTMNVEAEGEKRTRGFQRRLSAAANEVKKASGELNQALELGEQTLIVERQAALQAAVKKQRQVQAQVEEEREQTERMLRTARKMQLAP